MDLSTIITAGTSAITLGKSLWDTYSDQIPDWLKDKVKEKGQKYAEEKWQEFKYPGAEKEYKTKLAQNHGTIRLLGSGGDSDPVPLDGIFTDVYILNQTLASRTSTLEDLRESDAKLYGHNVKRQNGIELIKKESSKRLFILGKPGAGKTTFLKYITLQAIKGDLAKTPIFINMHQWSRATKTENGHKVELSLMEFIIQQFEPCKFPDAKEFIQFLLEKGDAIVLFDGLDEVNSSQNNRITNEVEKFCNNYTQAQCLITCRIAATEYSFEHFIYREMADFNDYQIENFVKKWFIADSIKCEKFLSDFKKPENSGVQKLARTPLLLGMLCLGFSDSMEFSSRRIDIYEDAIDALLRKWDKRRNIERDTLYKGLSHNLKKRLFTKIAYETFEKNQYLIEEKVLINHLDQVLKQLPNPEGQDFDGKLFLKSIEAQHGIFVERAQKYYSFVHLTFQEYFTACAIKGNEPYQQALMKNINNQRWREVFLLTASSLDDAGNFFSIFKKSIDNLIIKDEKILNFLTSVKNMTKNIKSNYQTKDIYLFYILLEIAIYSKSAGILSLGPIRTRTRAITIPKTLALALARTIDLDIAINLDLDLDLAFTLALTRDRDLDLDLTIDLATDFTINHNLDLDLDLDLDLGSKDINYNYHLCLLNIISTSSRFISESDKTLKVRNFIEQTSLQKQEKITLKTSIANHDWSKFKSTLSTTTKRQHAAHKFDLSNNQINTIINYLEANQLCCDCLKLAGGSPPERRAINDSLFFTEKPSN